MAAIAHARLPRALCNWRPPSYSALGFTPQVAKSTDPERKLNTFKLRSERIGGAESLSEVRLLTIREEKAGVTISAHRPMDRCIELTPEGPVFFKQDRTEIPLNSTDYLLIDPEKITLEKKGEFLFYLLQNPTIHVFTFVLAQDGVDEWPIEWVGSYNEQNKGKTKNAKEFLVITVNQDFAKRLGKKIKNKVPVAFIPDEIVHLQDHEQIDQFRFLSTFKVGVTVITVSTLHPTDGSPQTSIIISNTENTAYCLRKKYRDRSEALSGHMEIVSHIKQNGMSFLRPLITNETLDKAA